MTKSKKQIREYQAQIAAERVLKEQLNESNDAYNQRAFRYLRFLVHLLAAAQFIYGIYYYWFNVYFPNDLAEEEELKTRWGGKFKYLTFLNVILQAIYHSVALLNDIFGTNVVNPKQPVPALRQVKDFIFAAWAFPVAMNVCISFWVIYAIDRELIFPAALDEIFPTWLNHIVHTNVAMMIIMDMFTCFRVYPTRLIGVVDNMIFMVLYLIWLHIVRYFSGQWVYPLLEVLNVPMRYLMLSGMLAFTVLCYFLGEYLNNMVWAPELKILKKKAKLG